jgi:hypothetical protein
MASLMVVVLSKIRCEAPENGQNICYLAESNTRQQLSQNSSTNHPHFGTYGPSGGLSSQAAAKQQPAWPERQICRLMLVARISTRTELQVHFIF